MHSPDELEPLLLIWRPKLQHLAAMYVGNDAAHDLRHLERVWANALQILASDTEANRLVIMAACYLHDLINLPKNHPERAKASVMSAREAVVQLMKLGFPEEYLGDVAHAIEAHSYSAGIDAKSMEAKIVQDADRLDALGAVGLARMFHVGGQLNRALAHATDPLAVARSVDDLTYTLDHIEKKLLRLPATMHTPTGRKLAFERASLLVRFRDQFVAEWMA